MSNYRDDVADVAYAAALAARQGKATYRPFPDAETMNLRETGWCARFVRQCHEAAMQVPPFAWPFAATPAREMERRLKGAGKATKTPRPGDIIAMNNTDYAKGHIGIYLGVRPELGEGEFIAHNTSLRRGGKWGPGTCFTPLKLVAKTVSGYYAVLPSRPDTKPLAVRVVLDGREIACHPELVGATTRVDLRPVAEALGATVDATGWPIVVLRRGG